MNLTMVVAIIGASASLLCTVVVGTLSFFIKKMLTSFEEADKKNAQQIEKTEEKFDEQLGKMEEKFDEQNAKMEEKFNDLKADLPLLYVTREDFIRVMTRVENKLDQLIFSNGAKGKEE